MEVDLSCNNSSFDNDRVFRSSIQWLNYAYLVSIKISARDERIATGIMDSAREITHQLCNEEVKSQSEFDFICNNIQRCSILLKQAKKLNFINSTDYDVATELLTDILNPLLHGRFWTS